MPGDMGPGEALHIHISTLHLRTSCANRSEHPNARKLVGEDPMESGNPSGARIPNILAPGRLCKCTVHASTQGGRMASLPCSWARGPREPTARQHWTVLHMRAEKRMSAHGELAEQLD